MKGCMSAVVVRPAHERYVYQRRCAAAHRLFNAVVKTGAEKALLPWWKVFWLSTLAGAYLGLGATFYLYVGGQLPSIQQSDAGLQKLVLG